LIDAYVTVGESACGSFRHDPQLLEADDRQCPKIKLARALIVHRVIEVRDGFLGRHTQLEVELADARLDGLGADGLFLSVNRSYIGQRHSHFLAFRSECVEFWQTGIRVEDSRWMIRQTLGKVIGNVSVRQAGRG